MFITVSLKRLLKLLAALILLAIVLILVLSLSHKTAADTLLKTSVQPVLVIDPGHGGIDGGAVSADGSKESDVNLSVCMKMRSLSDLLGIQTVMTRDTDTSGAEPYSERGNLLDRAAVANSTDGAVLISVHQNTYPSDAPRGAETLYAKTDGSKKLGLLVQDALISAVDSSNRRVARPAPEKLLLTASVTCPAVLVECGFMSNPDEARLLSTDDYQKKIAFALVCAYLQFTNTDKQVIQ